jgi:hypothetical protein
VKEHRARFVWSAERLRRGLPTGGEYIHPARFTPDAPPWSNDTWSLAATFAPSAAEQGSPSIGGIRFWVSAAPHDRLVPGTRLWVFEGSTLGAVVDVLD